MLRSMIAPTLSALAGVGVVMSASVRADEVRFKNGDRLTGKIVSGEAGKLTIKTAVAGKLEVNLSDIETFSTDEPVSIKLESGLLRSQSVKPAAGGQIAVTPSGAPAAGAAPTNVSIASIRAINPKTEWSGSVVAGALVTRGNSDTDAFNLSFDALRRTDNDRLNLNAQYLFGRQRSDDTGEKVTATDNWRAGAKYDYFIEPKFYVFGGIAVEKDRIADLDIRITPSAGVGYQWVERPNFNFSTEAGLAYVYQKYDNGDVDRDVSLKLAYHLDRSLRTDIKLFHNLTYYPSVQSIQDYLVETDAGIRADLTEKMFTEFKVELRYDPTPAPEASRNDLRYILGVGWKF